MSSKDFFSHINEPIQGWMCWAKIGLLGEKKIFSKKTILAKSKKTGRIFKVGQRKKNFKKTLTNNIFPQKLFEF